MKKIAIIILIAYASTVVSEPCKDSLFLQLQKTDTITLTQEDKNYLQSSEMKCKAYKDSIDAKQRKEDKKWLILRIAGGVVASTLGVFILIWMFQPNDELKNGQNIYSGN